MKIDIVLTNGKNISINATGIEWTPNNRMIGLFDGPKTIARINMDNVVGWINADVSKSHANEE